MELHVSDEILGQFLREMPPGMGIKRTQDGWEVREWENIGPGGLLAKDALLGSGATPGAALLDAGIARRKGDPD